jgi:hypothetical protein
MYQADLPSLVKIGLSYLRIRFEFADALLQHALDGQQIAVQGTVLSRASAQTTIPIANAQFVCREPECEIKRVRRWIKNKKACFRKDCKKQFSDFWTRTEQKQVDTHLTSDLLTARYADEYDALVLVSDDLDFVPAMATAASVPKRSLLGCMRFDVLPSYMDSFLIGAGVRIINY